MKNIHTAQPHRGHSYLKAIQPILGLTKNWVEMNLCNHNHVNGATVIVYTSVHVAQHELGLFYVPYKSKNLDFSESETEILHG